MSKNLRRISNIIDALRKLPKVTGSFSVKKLLGRCAVAALRELEPREEASSQCTRPQKVAAVWVRVVRGVIAFSTMVSTNSTYSKYIDARKVLA
jgi:hypothetical protein